MFQRSVVAVLRQRLTETDNPLMQVLVGPRQTGKSTMIAQALQNTPLPYISVSADYPTVPSADWLRTQWQQARNLASPKQGALLVIDEIQQVPSWSRTVKSLWDEDRATNLPLKVILSGSSTLLLTAGLEESLLGRFELLHSTHWSFRECKEAFGYSLDDFLFFGGFPGAARLVKDEARWRDYVRNAIVEPTISLDALQIGDIRKPALIRALFTLGARFSAQELSFNKMLGQLHDAGNTTTLAGYLDILGKVGMITGLSKYHSSVLTSRKSSPRLLVFDTALITATHSRSKQTLKEDTETWGHLVESAVGAHLLAGRHTENIELFWWRDGAHEVDFVISRDDTLVALEVKSGRQKPTAGLEMFVKKYPSARRLVVGGGGRGAVSLEDFLATSVSDFLQ